MSNDPFQQSFAPNKSTDWHNRIEKELRGKNFDDFLIWKSIDGFEIESWQDSLPKVRPSLHPLDDAWKIIEPVYEENAQLANKAALHALMNGAEGIWFGKGFLGAAAEVVRTGIDEQIAPVFINGNTHIDIYKEPLKSGNWSDFETTDQTISLNGLRLRERGATAIDEIAILLAQAIEQFRGHAPNKVFLFKTGVSASYLTEIAKIRALRWLWLGILKKEGLSPKNPTILAVNLCNFYSINDPYTNNLRATSSALSSILGGAQYLMIEPWDKHTNSDKGFSQRISRNIQTLLKEESKMDKSLNPCDGSFFLENLTYNLANKAWDLVQLIEQSGGFTAYAKSGQLKAQLETSRTSLLEAYTSSKKILIGVNKFPPKEQNGEIRVEGSYYECLPAYINLAFEIEKSRL